MLSGIYKNEIENLKREIEELKTWKKSLEASHSIPLNIDQSFRERFLSDVVTSSDILSVANGGTGVATITSGGILKGAGTGAITTVAPLSGSNTFWAAATSGGATTRGINITDGVVVSFS